MLVPNEALGVDEPFKLVQEQAALGVEGWLAVLEGAVDAPVRGRQRPRQAALGAADVVLVNHRPLRCGCRSAAVTERHGTHAAQK